MSWHIYTGTEEDWQKHFLNSKNHYRQSYNWGEYKSMMNWKILRLEKIDTKKLDQYDIIITLCEDAKDNCPIINSNVKHIHWGIEDPAKFSGSNDEVIRKFSEIRDIILEKIKLLQISLEKMRSK